MPIAVHPSPELRERLEEALLAFRQSLDSPESVRGYRDDWERWALWLRDEAVHPLAAKPLHVLRYLVQLHDEGKAKATRARALAVIRSTYAALVVAFSDIPGVLDTNPAREVKNIKVSSDPRTPWLSAEELQRLMVRPPPEASWVQRRDWLICATLMGTGWRRSEIARTRRDQLLSAPGGFAARIRAKGGKEAIVPIPVWLSTEVDAWCRENGITAGPIFPQQQGSDAAVGPTTVRNALKRTAKRAGLDLTRATPHAIRRSFATVTGQRGVSLEDRQAAMLHSSKTTTERYDKAARLPEQAPGEVLRDLVGGWEAAPTPPPPPVISQRREAPRQPPKPPPARRAPNRREAPQAKPQAPAWPPPRARFESRDGDDGE